MKPTTEQVLAWARDAGYTKVDPTKNPIEILERFATLAYAAGAAAMKERAAKVCHDRAWELKNRAMNETGRVQRTRLNSEAIGWHDAHGAIRALGDDDEIS